MLLSLADLGCLDLPPDLMDFVFPMVKRGLRERQKEIRVTVEPGEFAIEIIYVQPEKTLGNHCIDFDDFARIVQRHDDQLSRLFAEHLRRWKTPAGNRSSRTAPTAFRE